MDSGEKLRLKNMYSQMPDQQIIDMLLEGEQSFQEGAYALLLEEASRRGLQEQVSHIMREREKAQQVQENARSDPGKDLVCIFRTAYMSEISLIKSILEASDIPFQVDNEHFASLRGAADGAINFGVMVANERAEEAKELLREFIAPSPKDDAPGQRQERDSSASSALIRLRRNPFFRFGVLALGLYILFQGLILVALSIQGYIEKVETAGSLVLLISGIATIALGGVFVRAFVRTRRRERGPEKGK